MSGLALLRKFSLVQILCIPAGFAQPVAVTTRDFNMLPVLSMMILIHKAQLIIKAAIIGSVARRWWSTSMAMAPS